MDARDRTILTVITGAAVLGVALVISAAVADDFIFSEIGGILGGVILVFCLLGLGFMLARRTEGRF